MKKQVTLHPKEQDIEKKWIVLDAESEILGRLASKAAGIVRGKNKVLYTPAVDTGDFVVIINAEKIKVTGNKATDKFYYNHSGYPGGLRTIAFQDLLKKKPTDVLYRAIWGMLPHNRLGRRLMTKVKIYAGPNHPHKAQVAEKKAQSISN